MPPKPSPILGGFSTQRSPNAADNEAVNLAVEIIETKDGVVPGYLRGMSGLDLLYTVGNGPIRGMLALKDTLYVVSGAEVYSVSANATKTLLGTVNGTSGPVSMFQNTQQLLILDGIGAWLVPGGFPLTGGTIQGGSLYALGDKVVLKANDGGTQSAFPEIEITAISNNPATAIALVNGGTTYTGATNVATSPIQPQAGIGTGLTLNITAVSGQITAAAINAGGSGWAVGDTGTITGGGGSGAWFQVLTAPAGVVGSLRLLARGSGYGTATGAATATGAPFPANIGIGLAVNTSATAGPVTGLSISNGGSGYQAGNVASINGGTSDATFLITSVGGNGVVTGFNIISGGAISSAATSFSQQSTDGEGQNLTLQSPSFGSFIGLVPITMPFDNPVAGIVIDGFGLAVFLGQQVIAQSNQQDLSTWPALSFGTANQSPDNVMSIATMHDEAYIFKEKNTEIWANQGTSPFAFGPITGAHMSFGTPSPFSISKTDNELMWIARNEQGQGTILKASAYAPQLISTQALTTEIQKYATMADAIAYSREEDGHSYYVLTFPSANVTWCYDKTASELVGFPIWTKMAALSNGELIRHWGNAFTTWAGAVAATSTQTTYQAKSVTMVQTDTLETSSGLTGLVTSFSTAVFSVWVLLPDGSLNSGIVFGNQQGGVEPGIQITVEDDGFGGPQLGVKAWDASSNPIVDASYAFTAWTNWVNVLVSIDTTTNTLQVWANTLTSNQLVESELTPSAITWSSTNPIGAPAGIPWSLRVAQ
jgi:hypothetical protein